ncbi:MAG: cell wall hydrolase [Cyanothece sp. SIO1E1]|nr:cell wall hydrolase [Cyanothece sp. SIO1E1]
MGRIFISAGHGGLEDNTRDPGAIVADTTEAEEMILLRDLIVPMLRSRSFEVLIVPDDLGTLQSIDWINARARTEDTALEIHTGAFGNPAVRGASVFYIANNETRRGHAELMLIALLRQVTLPSRGARPDTATGLGSLAFCRQVVVPSLQMEVVALTNPDDRALLQNRRRNLAVGIADGLASWSRAVAGLPAPEPSPIPDDLHPKIGIELNRNRYDEPGIIVNGNAYIPLDLVDQLGIDLSQSPEVRRINYGNVVYVKAVELRSFSVSVGWNSETRTVILRSILQICPGDLDRLMGHGNVTEMQLTMFLKTNNEQGVIDFPDLPKLYREEASIEGINYDIAFSQMCVETGFLRFGGNIKPEQNNFAGLGSLEGGTAGASFQSARIGVRAHIQHMKAYASNQPLVQQLVDPRFRFVTRGIAPLVDQLSGRWTADPDYGKKILSVLRRLYESAGLL